MASTRTTSVSIPQTAAAGGLTMTQPANTAAASYYKIAPSNYVTFGWNLTSLYATPTSLTLFATNTANGNSYPVGGNGAAGANTIPGTVTQIVWNPYQYEQQVGAVPLAVGTYRLAVWDERGPTAAVKGGVFNPYSGTEFALYRPQPYTPLARKLPSPAPIPPDALSPVKGAYTAYFDFTEWICTGCKSSALEVLQRPGPLLMLLTLLAMVVGGWGLVGRRRR